MSFAEYAALARQLAERRPAGGAGRRRNLHAAADHLERRLTAQGERLDQLGRAIGQPPATPPPTTGSAPPADPADGSALPAGPANGCAALSDATTGSGSPADPATGSAQPADPANGCAALSDTPTGSASPAEPAAASPAPVLVQVADSAVPPAPARSPDTAGPASGAGKAGGAADGPGRPGVGAYARVGETPAEADPAVELELARRCADEADRYGQQAELLARRPALLPAWSPVARAAVVHLVAAGIAALVLVAVVLVAGVAPRDAGWLVAGAPVVGWLVLRRWGRPAVTGPDDRQRAVLTRAVLTSRAKRTSGHG
ncbi:hypothetical protein Q3W71_23890 [Micromonospora sp. C28SCA-DRY-2]|uniref:hypothetical protein n=1 Tax=Micromonospora sp. C28SCA-DRY-2 TaxID=3059522 RepID=UPI0026774426|nr:hypothetical protein [Micromonospora sp. C28SCA-DRY-2]MDO3704709.1 hypothetical protein [Micromonospora sp. C28SCA-DRY-2]